jgi:hypothetical protein
MSHIVTIETEVRDASAVQAACERLKLPAAAHGLHELFSGTAQGLAVRFPAGRIRPSATSKRARSSSTTTAAAGATSTNWIGSFRPMRSRRPRLKPAARATRSPNKLSPTARSGSQFRWEVPLEDHRNHHLSCRPDKRRNQGLLRSRMPPGQRIHRDGPRPADG